MGGKTILALITAGIITIAILVILIADYRSFWKLWDIPVMMPHFADLRNLTGGAESIVAGYDPLHKNPGDPWGRRMHHPRIVQYIVSALGFNNNVTTFLGIIFIILFFLGIFVFCKPFDRMTALTMSIVIFSPAIMLGIERGNHDLFVFFLVCLALAVSSTPVATCFLLISAFIKLFPVFTVGYFLRCNKKRFWLWIITFAALFVIYLYLNIEDLKHIFDATQKGTGLLAYGSRSFAHISFIPSLIPPLAITISVLAIHINRVRAEGHILIKTDYIDAFRVGAGIYIGTFFLGNNWDYRQMFLIFTIPQLVAWRSDKNLGFLSVLTLVTVIAVCWSNMLFFAEIEEIFEWLLLSTFFYLFISTMPTWIQKEVFQFSLTNNSSRRPYCHR
jgi:hypothetical protein